MKAKTSFTAPLFVLILYGLIIASRFLKDRLISAGGNVYLSVIILQILVFLIPSIIFCRMKGIGYSVKLNIRLFSPSRFGSIIVTALLMILGSILIRFVQIYVGGLSSFRFSLYDTYLSGDSPYDFLFTATAFALMPALTEEFVFRAILLTEYNEAGFSAVQATLISSLLSSMMYFNLELFPIRLLAALFLCQLTYVTGSSLSAFLSHIIFNIYGIFGEKYILRAIADPSNKIISIFAFTLLFLLVAIILFGEYENILRRMGQTGVPTPSYRLKKAEDGRTPDLSATEAAEAGTESAALSESTRKGIEAFFSPTFLLCILIFVVAIFGSI